MEERVISTPKLHTIPGAESACFWEEATVAIDGRSFPAGGGCVNDAALIGYPIAIDARSGVITTFSQDVVLGRYWITSRYKQWNPLTRRREDMICYRVITPDRRVFAGRNGSTAYVLKTRQSKTLTAKLRHRLGLASC